jgi:hypothetical protein
MGAMSSQAPCYIEGMTFISRAPALLLALLPRVR